MTTASRRAGRLLVGSLVFGMAGLGFYHLWDSRVEMRLAQVGQGLRVMAADVDATVHGAVTGIRILRTEAELELRRPAAPPFLTDELPLMAREGGFTSPVPGQDLRLSSLLFGKEGLPEPASERAREMMVARELVPLMADVRERAPEAAWIYYTSAQGFTNLYPYQDRAMADALVWSDDFLSHPLFARMGAEHNPQREIRWQEAYLDQAGLGLMTSVVAPVDDEMGRHRAIVALDFTLSALDKYLAAERNGTGVVFLVNPSGQVLASAPEPTGEQLRRVGEVLPAGFTEPLQALSATPRGSCVSWERWYLCGRSLQEAPWQMLSLVDRRALGWGVLAGMQVEMAGMALLLLLLVAMERSRRLAEGLREGAARYRRIIEASDQGFWDWNIPERRFSASPRLDAILGYAPGQSPLRQPRWREVVHSEDLPRLRASVRHHLQQRAPFHHQEFRARARNGEWRWLLTQGRVVERDAQGRAVIMSGTLTDISARKQAEADLLAAKQAAEAANAAKSRFLAAASHDLRQPLQASNLFISVLKRSPLDEDQQKIAHNLSLATKALGELLDSLLDISKLDAGVVTPQLAPVEIYEIFQRIESEFASLALEKDLRFKLFFPTRPLVFATDMGLLMGLLRNLVGNAIRYTEWGGVLVGTRLRQGQLVIQVWDTGIGIKDEDKPRIYEEFFQVDNPQRDRVKGLGLGLSIVRRMAELLGYGLACQSRYGRGTVFEISIPLAPDQAPALPKPSARQGGGLDTGALRGCQCVLVEDDPLVAGALGAWLESHGIRLRHFPDGEQALADPQITGADFYITDFRMPGELDGIQFLEAVSRLAGRAVLGVIVTGDTSREQIDAFATAAWPVLHKPIAPERLLEVLASLRRDGLGTA